jgi:formyltetrahydrofolate-dependent phosphoribosylglycinamide formyltransferase
MLQKLKQRWKVNSLNLVLIILTFALGGSLCGIAGRKILAFTGLEKGAAWIILYILLITLLWPICVLLISIPLGQFRFFNNYIKRLFTRMSGKSKAHKEPLRIAIFASGAGSNAQKIIDRFRSSADIKIALIVCNKPGAGVLEIASKEDIPTLVIEKERFFKSDAYLPELQHYHIGFIVLAGFLWKLPQQLIKAYPKKIINIHPALLPNYGGKGMYGHFVHEAVIANSEKESGITIHYVDELYDHGEIIVQEKCSIIENETADSLAQKIHALEHQHYPAVIEKLLQKAKS